MDGTVLVSSFFSYLDHEIFEKRTAESFVPVEDISDACRQTAAIQQVQDDKPIFNPEKRFANQKGD
jgi:hypothetical protein